ncbi:MAG: HAD family hydrolase [Chloroflexota bacterium]
MLSPNGIKSILFDLDGTLRLHTPKGSDVFNTYGLSLGLPLHPEDITRAARWEHYYFANSPEIKADNEKYRNQKFENDSFWINFGRRRLIALGCSSAQAVELAPQFSAHLSENYKPQVHVPEGAPVLLKDLKEAGFILGLVSNRDEPFDVELEELGLREFFQFTLAAGEVNSYKPDRAIFDEAVKRAGTSASETMYVGDNYFADIVGSRRAGLRPVLYDPIRLFPDAGCPVVTAFDQVTALL